MKSKLEHTTEKHLNADIIDQKEEEVEEVEGKGKIERLKSHFFLSILIYL